MAMRTMGMTRLFILWISRLQATLWMMTVSDNHVIKVCMLLTLPDSVRLIIILSYSLKRVTDCKGRHNIMVRPLPAGCRLTAIYDS